jgi:hypothetical protein
MTCRTIFPEYSRTRRQSYWDSRFDFIGTNFIIKTRTTLVEQQKRGEGILFLEGYVLAH